MHEHLSSNLRDMFIYDYYSTNLMLYSVILYLVYF